MGSMSELPRKPLKWVGSAKRDLDAMPEAVKDVFGHAIDLAQAGGKHQDAKVMTGFGSAGVQERHQDTERRHGPDPRQTQGREAGLRGLASKTRNTMKSRNTQIAIEAGSTNVYADLGYVDAAEMQRKSQLAAEIARTIKARRLTQLEAAELLGIDQSKVSRITRGQFRGVSEGKLLELVTKLGRDVKIVVGPVHRRAGKIEIQFA